MFLPGNLELKANRRSFQRVLDYMLRTHPQELYTLLTRAKHGESFKRIESSAASDCLKLPTIVSKRRCIEHYIEPRVEPLVVQEMRREFPAEKKVFAELGRSIDDWSFMWKELNIQEKIAFLKDRKEWLLRWGVRTGSEESIVPDLQRIEALISCYEAVRNKARRATVELLAQKQKQALGGGVGEYLGDFL